MYGNISQKEVFQSLVVPAFHLISRIASLIGLALLYGRVNLSYNLRLILRFPSLPLWRLHAHLGVSYTILSTQWVQEGSGIPSRILAHEKCGITIRTVRLLRILTDLYELRINVDTYGRWNSASQRESWPLRTTSLRHPTDGRLDDDDTTN